MTEVGSVRSHAAFWAAWHSLAIAALFGVAGLRSGTPPWSLSSAEISRTALLSTGYILGAALLHLLRLRNSPSKLARLFEAALAGLAGYGITGLYILIADIQISRSAILLASACGLGLLVLSCVTNRLRPGVLATLGVGVVALFLSSGSSRIALPKRPSSRVVTEVSSSLYSLRVIADRNIFPRSASFHTGGGLALFRDGFLTVTSDGDLYSITPRDNELPRVEELPLKVPMNRAEFAAVAGEGAFRNYFRALDVLVQDEAGSRRVYVSHHWWREDARCFVVRVSMYVDALDVTPEWQTIHDTEPCLPIVESEPGWPFRGMEGGGRMAFLDGHQLLLTVGDQGFNAVDFEDQPDYVQDPTASYGKTILIDITTGAWRPFTTGHRNAQGLLVDPSGEIWLTEHGPQGGDELNKLQDGGNYGWPIVTLGTDYGREAWPRNPRQGRHEGYLGPAYAWIPSVGISNLFRVRGGLFASWSDDFLIGSLVGETLLRVRVDDGAVRFVEPIRLGERVRDLVEDRQGRIVVLTDSYGLLTIEPTQLDFAMCAGCHSLSGTQGRGLGPDLAGLIGRRVASSPDFGYSSALNSLGGAWSEDRLNRFLEDPQGFAPGTTMTMQGIADPAVRARLLSYLRGR